MDDLGVSDLLLAIVQGVTEIFPVSSSAHLVALATLLKTTITFDRILILHLGTFLAILLYYWERVVSLVTGREGWTLPFRILISFGVTAVVGFIINVLFIQPYQVTTRPNLVASLWMGYAMTIMLVSSYAQHRKPRPPRRLRDLGLGEFVLIGVAQGLAAPPGISRLGLTLGTSTLVNLAWSEALALSFILSLPTILAANLFQLVQPTVYLALGRFIPALIPLAMEPHANGLALQPADLVLVLVVFLCGWLALRLLARYVYVGPRFLAGFGGYSLIAGLFLLLYLGLFAG